MAEATDASAGILAGRPDSPLAAAERMLRTPPPDVSEAEAEATALLRYGRRVKAQALTGERDRNFLLRQADGGSLVLKVYHSADDAETRALQHGALVHVRSRDPACPVPDLIPAPNGREEVSLSRGGPEAAVLIRHLPGLNPVAADLTPALRADVGRVVGRLSRALSDYRRPRARRTILWDLMLVADLRPLLALIEPAGRRRTVALWLDRFTTGIRPAAARLPQQPIHNDLSLSNILVDPARRDRVAGVIDFGDLVQAPRINEFAIAASYFIGADDDPATAMAEILAAVGPDLQLTRAEVALMPDLVRARLATRILLSGWRARLFPHNQAYILRSNRAAWELWDRLDHAGPLGERLLARLKGQLE